MSYPSALYPILHFRHQTRIRQTDLVIRLYSAVSSKDFLEAYEKLINREVKSVNDYKRAREHLVLFYVLERLYKHIE